jgi:hypothetical protein
VYIIMYLVRKGYNQTKLKLFPTSTALYLQFIVVLSLSVHLFTIQKGEVALQCEGIQGWDDDLKGEAKIAKLDKYSIQCLAQSYHIHIPRIHSKGVAIEEPLKKWDDVQYLSLFKFVWIVLACQALIVHVLRVLERRTVGSIVQVVKDTVEGYPKTEEKAKYFSRYMVSKTNNLSVEPYREGPMEEDMKQNLCADITELLRNYQYECNFLIARIVTTFVFQTTVLVGLWYSLTKLTGDIPVYQMIYNYFRDHMYRTDYMSNMFAPKIGCHYHQTGVSGEPLDYIIPCTFAAMKESELYLIIAITMSTLSLFLFIIILLFVIYDVATLNEQVKGKVSYNVTIILYLLKRNLPVDIFDCILRNVKCEM